ncbi:hypothetical protein COL30_19295 [Bacillus pseudomycoides]|nr:hypothetical protein COO19_12290 [Bacillus pseudomycoides]PEI94424.1 hypothetical protein CN686_16295 [Bacillus pseudomycoides]PEK15617.1 hypothetical protein CN693_22290 [Bacillus pseudomycoides]PEM69209.1 hypothetical protein CN619_22020 [Bacillus pseudomycoides]PEO23740.1 hypothetical protein CN542_00635 [Bacillus pseudomycoides]
MTPLLQLNLFLHMTLDYTHKSNFNPYFKKQGYVLKSIEESIPLNPEVYQKISAVTKISQRVTPEMILKHQETGNLLLLECKVKSFDSNAEDRACRQALGYLSLTPEYLSEFLGGTEDEKNTASLLYATDHNHTEKLNSTLNKLKSTVLKTVGRSLEPEILGIEINKSGCFIQKKAPELEDPVKIVDLPTLQEKAILYLIPFEPNSSIDEYGKLVLEKQVRNTIRAILGRNLGNTEFTFTSTDICKAINPLWDKLPSKLKKKIKRIVHTYILDVIRVLKTKNVQGTHEEQIYKFPPIDQNTLEKVRRFLITNKFIEVGKDSFDEIDQLTIEEFLESELM